MTWDGNYAKHSTDTWSAGVVPKLTKRSGARAGRRTRSPALRPRRPRAQVGETTRMSARASVLRPGKRKDPASELAGLTHTHTHTLSLSHTHRSLTHNLTHTLTHSLTHTLTQTITRTLAHTLSHTHTLPHTLTHTHTLSPRTHTHSLSHTHTHSCSWHRSASNRSSCWKRLSACVTLHDATMPTTGCVDK